MASIRKMNGTIFTRYETNDVIIEYFTFLLKAVLRSNAIIRPSNDPGQ